MLSCVKLKKILIQVPSDLKLFCRKKYERSSIDRWIVGQGLNLCAENNAHVTNGYLNSGARCISTVVKDAAACTRESKHIKFKKIFTLL